MAARLRLDAGVRGCESGEAAEVLLRWPRRARPSGVGPGERSHVSHLQRRRPEAGRQLEGELGSHGRPGGRGGGGPRGADSPGQLPLAAAAAPEPEEPAALRRAIAVRRLGNHAGQALHLALPLRHRRRPGGQGGIGAAVE